MWMRNYPHLSHPSMKDSEGAMRSLLIRDHSRIAITAIIMFLAIVAIPKTARAKTQRLDYVNYSLISALRFDWQVFTQGLGMLLDSQPGLKDAFLVSNVEEVKQPTSNMLNIRQVGEHLRFDGLVDTQGEVRSAYFEFWPDSNMTQVQRTKEVSLRDTFGRRAISDLSPESHHVSPGTTYRVQLVAITKDGERIPSRTLDVHTSSLNEYH